MLPDIPDYTVQEILIENDLYTLCRAIRQRDNQSCFLRILGKGDFVQQKAQLSYEQEIRHRIAPESLRSFEIEVLDTKEMMVVEECDGLLLHELIKARKIDLKDLLAIGISLAKSIQAIHNQKVRLGNLTPQSIVVNVSSKEINILDFSCASIHIKEIAKSDSALMNNPFYSYSSPEQIGWINRLIDYRADIYSFGVILYEMLTNRLPFPGETLRKMMYQQIAGQPISPHVIDEDHPEPISGLILKCLADTPEDRYQSAYGIEKDLEECLRQLNIQGFIENFELGVQDTRDTYGRFWISKSLYGRNEELQILEQAANAISIRSSYAVFISGEHGVGKTHVIQEFKKNILKKKDLFVSYKCSFHEKTTPYNVFSQVIKRLTEQVIWDAGPDLDLWKERLDKALGVSEKLLVELIPYMKTVINNQTDFLFEDLEDTEKALYFLVENFFSTFPSERQKLVLFFDDLHWADISSLRLLQFLISGNMNSILILGTWSELECEKNKLALLQEIASQKRNGIPVKQIVLKALSFEAVQTWLTKDLCGSSSEFNWFVEELYKKTAGNPLYVTMVLESFWCDKLLVYDSKARCWYPQKSNSFFNKFSTLENLIQKKIQLIESPARYLLVLSALIGDPLSIATLAYMHKAPLFVTIGSLEEALQTEFLLTSGFPYFFNENITQDEIAKIQSDLVFSSESVRIILYNSLSEEDRVTLHVAVGKMFLELYNPEKNGLIFSIIARLNEGKHCIGLQKERQSLANFNAIGSTRALHFAAFDEALLYASTGIDLLEEADWEKNYITALTLYKNCFTCLIKKNLLEEGEKFFSLAYSKAKSTNDKEELFLYKIMAYISTQKMEEAFRCGMDALEAFGISESKLPMPITVQIERVKIKSLLFLKGIDKIENSIKKNDPVLVMVSRLYHTLVPLAYALEGKIVTMMLLKGVHHALQYGMTKYSATIMTLFGSFLASEQQQDYETGRRVCDAVLRGAVRYPESSVSIAASVIAAVFITPWKQHIRVSVEDLKGLERKCLQIGKPFYSSQSLLFISIYMLTKGDPLELVFQEGERNIEKIIQNRTKKECLQVLTILGTCLALKGQTNDPAEPSIEEIITKFDISNEKLSANDLVYVSCRIFLLYLNEDYGAAVDLAFQQYERILIGGPLWRMIHFYHALSLAALCQNEENKKKYEGSLKQEHERIQKWAEVAPFNHLHQYLIISAAVAYLNGKIEDAIDLYEQAIVSAEENEYFHEEAIALELAAKLYNESGKKKLAAFYMQEAYFMYAKWGAVTKIKRLNEKYGDLISVGVSITQTLTQESVTTEPKLDVTTTSGVTSTTATTSSEEGSTLDVTSIIQASQEISAEIVFDKLLMKLMSIVMAHADAGKALLLLIENDKLVVRAEMHSGEQYATLFAGASLESKQNQLCVAIVKHVEKNKRDLLLNDAMREGNFIHDPYIVAEAVHSVLCVPLIHQAKLIGILYLENKSKKGAFATDFLRALSLLSSQIAISIENALFYTNLEVKVEERTKELKRMQNQLIQQEKMASLGLLTAGIAHEIKNPLNFVINFSELSEGLLSDIETYFEKHAKEYTPEEQNLARDSMLSMKANIDIVKEQGLRADSIVKKMLEHSVGKAGELVPTDIRKLIEEVKLLSYHTMHAKDPLFETEIQTDFDLSVEKIDISAEDISRVLQNLLDNAYYAVTKKKQRIGESFNPLVTIKTRNLGKQYEIRIHDNGDGIPKEIKEKIFTPFFTTRPMGEGTGLGLSLSHSIVTQQHDGSLTFTSEEGNFTEFVITLPIKAKLKSQPLTA